MAFLDEMQTAFPAGQGPGDWERLGGTRKAKGCLNIRVTRSGIRWRARFSVCMSRWPQAPRLGSADAAEGIGHEASAGRPSCATYNSVTGFKIVTYTIVSSTESRLAFQYSLQVALFLLHSTMWLSGVFVLVGKWPNTGKQGGVVVRGPMPKAPQQSNLSQLPVLRMGALVINSRSWVKFSQQYPACERSSGTTPSQFRFHS